MGQLRNLLLSASIGALTLLPISTVLAQPEPSIESPTPSPAEESEADSELGEATPSPEEIQRYQTLAEADKLYQEGSLEAAEQLYRQAKPPFDRETEQANIQSPPKLIKDPAELSPAGKVYWREYQAGLARGLETRIFMPLRLLVEQYPQFIPGHLHLAAALADDNLSDEALQVLERALQRYPNRVDLLRATIAGQAASENWLDASLTAREFALLNPEHPLAAEFTRLADDHLERFKLHLRRRVRGNAIGNAVVGTLGYALTGNIFGPLSALETTLLLLRGESGVGEKLAKRLLKRLPMVEDEEVLEYVGEMGEKLAQLIGRDDFEYDFYVVLDENLNAFALPGGKIFVNAGAIVKTKSEAELAGLLAHELSHVVLSHGFQLVTKGSLTSNVVQYIPYAGGIASRLLVFSYSRDMERQADIVGTRILASSDYAADGMRNLMVALDNEDRPSPPPWLSTHPDTSARVENLEAVIIRNGYNRYAYEGVERHAQIQARVKQLLQEQKEQEEEEEADEEQETQPEEVGVEEDPESESWLLRFSAQSLCN
ncbi:MAG: M48 family metalloprotease [Hormoscilla sp. GM102CHS1]|nr:M48 family metalloprotease [Hormoscilla sp. GM102CHS1]